MRSEKEKRNFIDEAMKDENSAVKNNCIIEGLKCSPGFFYFSLCNDGEEFFSHEFIVRREVASAEQRSFNTKTMGEELFMNAFGEL